MAYSAVIQGNTSQSAVNVTSAPIKTADGVVGYCADYFVQANSGVVSSGSFSSIQTAGSGYVVGDVLTQLGGQPVPGNIAVEYLITAVGGGGTVTNFNAGYPQGNPGFQYYYRIVPANPLVFFSSGVSCQLSVTWAQLWPNGPYAPVGTPTILAAGTLYHVGDILTLSSTDGTQWFDPSGNYPPSGIQIAFVVTSIGGGGAVTGVAYDQQAPNGLFITPPTNPISYSGGHGSGYTDNWTFSSSTDDKLIPRLAQWDLTTATKTFETGPAPFDTLDYIFGPMAIRKSDNHLFFLNGMNKLYHIAPGLTLVGSYTIASPPPSGIIGTWYCGALYQNYGGGGALIDQSNNARPGSDMAVGQNRLYIFDAIDFRGSFEGIDVFDVSGNNPSYLRTINWPGFPVFPAADIAPCLAVDPNNDTCYVVTRGPLSTQLGIMSIGPSDTIATDVTPFVYTDYAFTNTDTPPVFDATPGDIQGDNHCAFIIDPVNRVLIFGGCMAHGAAGNPNTYKITAYSLPSLSLLWHIDSFQFGIVAASTQPILGFHTIGGNIVDGKWITAVYSNYTGTGGAGPGTVIITAFDTLTGAVTKTIDSVDITNWSSIALKMHNGYVCVSAAAVPAAW